MFAFRGLLYWRNIIFCVGLVFLLDEAPSRFTLRVDWSVNSTGRGADDMENTASSVVACWTVFTELLPGSTLIRSVTIHSMYGASCRDSARVKTNGTLCLHPYLPQVPVQWNELLF
jgi:hypothetical protein